MVGLSPRARCWTRRAGAALLGALLWTPPLSSAAHAQAELTVNLSSSDYTGQAITLGGSADNIDWVKWGYPIIDDNDGPFSQLGLDAATLRQTHKASGTAIGALSALVPASGSPSEPYWMYVRSSTSGTRFSWTGGVPVASTPTDVAVSGGIAILPGSGPSHQGWGFAFTVAASSQQRVLDIYVDCPPNPDPAGSPPVTAAIVKAALGTVPSRTAQVCRVENKRVQKVAVNFAGDAEADAGAQSLAVSLTVDALAGVTRPIVLLAAVLRANDAATADGGVHAADGGVDASGPAPALADRPTACALAGDGAAADGAWGGIAGISPLVVLLLSRRRRAHRPAR